MVRWILTEPDGPSPMCAAERKRRARSAPTKAVDRMVLRHGMFMGLKSASSVPSRMAERLPQPMQEMIVTALLRPNWRIEATAMLDFTQAAAAFGANGSKE